MKKRARLAFLICLVLALSTLTAQAARHVKTWGDIDTAFGFSNVTGQWIWNNETNTNYTLANKLPSYIPALPAVGGAQTSNAVFYAWGDLDTLFIFDCRTADLACDTEIVDLDKDQIVPCHYREPPAELMHKGRALINTTVSGLSCDNTAFVGRTQYTFTAWFWSEDGGDTIDGGVGFYDAANNFYSIYYDASAGTTTLTSPNDGISGVTNEVDVRGNYTKMVFLISLNPTIADTVDADIYCQMADLTATIIWESTESNAFTIYNLGGRWGQLIVTGDAGRYDYGDVFELYANASSQIKANMTIKGLQHVQLQFGFLLGEDGLPSAGATDYIQYGFDYCDGSNWYEGWSCRIYPYDYTSDGNEDWIKYYVVWFYGDHDGAHLKSDYQFALYEKGQKGTTYKQYTRLWVDLWFDTGNFSRTAAGRVTSYYYGMYKSAAWWDVLAMFGTWGPVQANQTRSTFFHDLEYPNGTELAIENIDLVRVWCKVKHVDASVYMVGAKEYAVRDMVSTDEQMRGIDTPYPPETILLDAVGGGWLGGLIAAWGRFTKGLQNSLWQGTLTGWTWFLSFMDTIAAWTGQQNLFSNILLWFQSFRVWLTNMMSWSISLFTQYYRLMNVSMVKGLNTITTVIGVWVSMIEFFFAFLDGTYTTGVDLWDDLGLVYWVTLAAICYPVYLITLWDEHGGEALLRHISLMANLGFLLLNTMLTIGGFIIMLVSTLIESIPVIE